MFRRSLLLVIGAICLVMFGRTAHAQFVSKNITLSFFMPESVDPNKVVTFFNTNTQSVDGADLIPPSELEKGIEIHSAVPGPNGGIFDITSLTVQFTYNDPGAMVFISSQGTSGYASWPSATSVNNGVYTITFVLPSSPLVGAPINNNFVPGNGDPFSQSFASLSVSGSPDALNDFATMNMNGGVHLTPNQLGIERGAAGVPEPGVLALLSGLVVTAGIFSMSRLRRR